MWFELIESVRLTVTPDEGGRNYTKISANLFGCATARNKGTCENRVNVIHPNLAEVYRRKIADLNNVLHDKGTAPEAFELIRSLIADITLTPENGQLRIDLRGELAGILNLCSESKKPASRLGDGLEQIKMVAGAGFVEDPTMPELRKAV